MNNGTKFQCLGTIRLLQDITTLSTKPQKFPPSSNELAKILHEAVRIIKGRKVPTYGTFCTHIDEINAMDGIL